VKQVVQLVQTYLSLKTVELDIRPFTDSDEALDARGQPLIAGSVSITPASATGNRAVGGGNDVTVTSPADDDVQTGGTETRKPRKKRRSSRKSEGIEEQLEEQIAAQQPVNRGFHPVFTARCYACAVLAIGLCPSVCLSQVGVLSKWLDGSSWFLAWRLRSTSPTLCFKENKIQVSAKIAVLPSGTFS